MLQSQKSSNEVHKTNQVDVYMLLLGLYLSIKLTNGYVIMKLIAHYSINVITKIKWNLNFFSRFC